MPSRAAATEAASSAGPRYVQLAELGIDFVLFPDAPSKTVVAAVAATPGGRGRSPASERLPPGRRGVFVGQLPFGITPERLAFAVNTVLGREGVVMVSVAHRQSCGWVCLDDDAADEAFARSESAIVESSGLWIARNATQHRQLNDFCGALKARKYGEEVLKLQLPKATLTLKPTTASPAAGAGAAKSGNQEKKRGSGGEPRHADGGDGNAIGRAGAVVPLQPPPQHYQQHMVPVMAPQGAPFAFNPAGYLQQQAPTPQQQLHHHHHYQQQQQQQSREPMCMVPCGPPDPATGQQPMMVVPMSSLHPQQFQQFQPQQFQPQQHSQQFHQPLMAVRQ